MDGQYRIGDTVMKNWVIRKKLGEGSFGRVYEAEREDFGEIYRAALKIITVPQNEAEIQAALEEGMSPEEAERYFYSMVEEIVREVALMAKVKGTANVVSYEDHEVIRHSSGIGWDILIRMEELTPLLTYAYAHPFTRRDVIRLGIDLCRSLELCQRYNIIHRDIKPENIFVSENGDFKLGDFGIARTAEKTVSGLSKKGTYNYMAPEVYKGLDYGFSVDIYSLGIVLYRLLNKNRVPFLPPAPEVLTYHAREQALARRMSGEPITPPYYASGRLGEIILKAAAYDPKDRYSSPGQMRAELEAILYDAADAGFIYPEGDEVSLRENVYATVTRGREIGPEAEEDTSGEKETQEDFGAEEDEDDATVSAFGGRKPGGRAETAGAGKPNGSGSDSGGGKSSPEEEEPEEEKTVSAFGKKPAVPSGQNRKAEKGKKKSRAGLIAAAAAAAAVIVGGVILLATGQIGRDPSKESQETEGPGAETTRSAEEEYAALAQEAEELFDRDPEKTMELMGQALALRPEDERAQTDYAYALYRTKNYAACRSYAENDLSLGRSFADASLQSNLLEIVGAACYEQGEYAAAAGYFRSSSVGNGMSESAMRDYAVCLARLGSVSEAEDALYNLRLAGANSDVTRYVEGELAYAGQHYAEAEESFLSLLENGDDRTVQVRAFRSLAQLYRDCGSAEVIEANGGTPPIEGASIKEMRLLRDGIAEYNLIYDSSLYEMLGQAAYLAYGQAQELGETPEEDYRLVAADAFAHVLEMGIRQEYLYTNLYAIHYEVGDYAAAADDLDRMEEAFPNSYVPHALRGILLITLEGEKNEAERSYTAAREEYEKAGELMSSSDDRSYYGQLEALIGQLIAEGWLD